MSVLETRRCGLCGTEGADAGNGIFPCSHCDFPHGAGESCDLCRAMRDRLGTGPGQTKAKQPDESAGNSETKE